MTKGLHKSNIDYIRDSANLINRPGYVLNIVTGCKHYQSDICNIDCYARRMVEHGRLGSTCPDCRGIGKINPDAEIAATIKCPKCKGIGRVYHKSYPYGFSPTFHPERIRAIGGKPKLIFLNDMGDVGGDWEWKMPNNPMVAYSQEMAKKMCDFALLNPQHILLLLTKNPAWYRYAEWPDNVWCGFSATNNEEYRKRKAQLPGTVGGWWVSFEPWLDRDQPDITDGPTTGWYVIGGLSGPNTKQVSIETRIWLRDKSIQAKRFTKFNAVKYGNDEWHYDLFPREYPDEWKVKL